MNFPYADMPRAPARTWRADPLLPGFESLELEFSPDYDGPVVATLVRLPVADARHGAVLYVHGFNDYFFQRHMAARFAAEGHAFYALDLRKHGRSLRPWQHPNFCKRLDEYYAEMSAAIEEIGTTVVLAGHSTGGLLCALYANEGAQRAQVRGLWLNSAFLDWKLPDWKKVQLHLAAAMGRFYPFIADPRPLPPDYTGGLLADWEFDTRLKPLEGFPIYCGWLGAITDAHAKVHRGLDIGCPVLSMHSDEADIVLDWRQIARWSHSLGSKVKVLGLPGGVHDLVLSSAPVREEVFRQLFAWAARLEG
jgi:alpha-beta hydrolase superfamily lysophospholipase